jgi:hypothetical protein
MPRATKAPGGFSIKAKGSKPDHMTLKSRSVPEPSSSLIEPKTKRDMVKPRPMPVLYSLQQ